MDQPPREWEPRDYLLARSVAPLPPRLPRQVPWATLVLVFLNLLAAVAQLGTNGFRLSLTDLGSLPGDWALGAKVPSLVAAGEWWRLVTANFLHGSPLHLGGNCLTLLVTGTLIETWYGRARFVIIYILSSITGALASYFLTDAVSLGASTGITGLTGALVLHNFRYRDVIPRRLAALFPFLIGIVVVSFATDTLKSYVDVWGHAGGFLGGLIVAALYDGRYARADLALPAPGTRDYRRVWFGSLATAGILAYGFGGLFLALPAQVDLIAAGRSSDPLARADRLQRVVNARPHFVEARTFLADAYAEAGKDELAAAEFLRALKDSPGDPLIQREMDRRAGAIAWLARRAFDRGRFEECRELYRRSLPYAQTNALRAEVHNGYAWVLVDKLNKDLDLAEKSAVEALRAEPTSSAITDTLAWVYYKQGRLKEALETQQKALSLSAIEPRMRANNGELYYHLGAIQEKLGMIREALQSYRQAGAFAEAVQALRRLEPAPTPPTPPVPAPAAPLPPPQDPAVQRGII